MEVIARLTADESLGDRVMKVDHAGEHGAVNIDDERAHHDRAGLESEAEFFCLRALRPVVSWATEVVSG
jgi:demethoxyubiquinone hydroxylase (CLK1/Coq7/Cat5 family)